MTQVSPRTIPDDSSGAGEVVSSGAGEIISSGAAKSFPPAPVKLFPPAVAKPFALHVTTCQAQWPNYKADLRERGIFVSIVNRDSRRCSGWQSFSDVASKDRNAKILVPERRRRRRELVCPCGTTTASAAARAAGPGHSRQFNAATRRQGYTAGGRRRAERRQKQAEATKYGGEQTPNPDAADVTTNGQQAEVGHAHDRTAAASRDPVRHRLRSKPFPSKPTGCRPRASLVTQARFQRSRRLGERGQRLGAGGGRHLLIQCDAQPRGISGSTQQGGSAGSGSVFEPGRTAEWGQWAGGRPDVCRPGRLDEQFRLDSGRFAAPAGRPRAVRAAGSAGVRGDERSQRHGAAAAQPAGTGHPASGSQLSQRGDECICRRKRRRPSTSCWTTCRGWRERLAQQNIKVERFDVDLMDRSQSGTPGQAGGQLHSQPQFGRSGSPAARTSETGAAEPSPAAATPRSGFNGTNVLNVII